ncbi:MAG: tail fiber protein [Pseudomonadota bacterium]
MKHILSTLGAAAVAATMAPTQVAADVDPFIGTIQTFGSNFCPQGWAEANGALLAISQWDALFSLYGTIYGGDGRTTFGLPDLRGRGNVGQGTGNGLSPRSMGQRGGAEFLTYQIPNMAPHTHSVSGDIEGNTVASGAAPSTLDPTGAYYATFPSSVPIYSDPSTPAVSMGVGSVEFTSNATILNNGSGQQVYNQQPFMAMTTCVALVGIYPSRN